MHLKVRIAPGQPGTPYKRVRFYSTVDLVNALEQEKAKGKAGRIAMSLMRMDLVVLDELGYLPFSQAGGALLSESARLLSLARELPIDEVCKRGTDELSIPDPGKDAGRGRSPFGG